MSKTLVKYTYRRVWAYKYSEYQFQCMRNPNEFDMNYQDDRHTIHHLPSYNVNLAVFYICILIQYITCDLKCLGIEFYH